MSESKAEMFNRKAAKPKYKADKILEALSIKPGQYIADIGSGGGYYTFRFAELVGSKGKIYAVDVNAEFLDYIKKQAQEKGLENIVTVYMEDDKIDLLKHKLDYIFMRNVCHHIPKREGFFKQLKEFLKPNGKVVIVEYDGRGFFSFQKIFKHYVPKEILEQEMKDAGYKEYESFDFLTEQSFTIYISS